MTRVLMLLLSVAVLVGCGAPEPRVVVRERMVICPERIPDGLCPECPVTVEPESLRDLLLRSRACELARQTCAAWHQARDDARGACEE